MTDQTYQVLGVGEMPALGRAPELRRLMDNLRSETPASLCVIGPKHIGKTMLLRRFVREAEASPSRWTAVVMLDLRATTPTTDDEFRRALAEAVGARLEVRPDLFVAPFEYEYLTIAVTAFAKERKPLLVVLDGMDAVLHLGGLTNGLWQNLRALTQEGGVRYVTGSRAPLRDLCASESSRTSNFWEVFDPLPVHLGAFAESDWDAVLAPLRKTRTVEEPVRREIATATGGIPLLTAALLRHLCAGSGRVEVSEVERAADDVLAREATLMTSLWDDCTAEMQGDLADAARNAIPVAGIPEARRRELALRGMTEESGSKLKVRAKIVQRFIAGRDQAVADLRRHFGDIAAYERSIPRVLEHRLGHVPRGKVDPALRSKVEKALRELASDSPGDTLTWLRGVFELGIAAVWRVEAPGAKVPDAIYHALLEQRDPRLALKELPAGDTAMQLGMLRVAMGRQGVARVTKHVTKRTYILLSMLKDAGDFGQHPDAGETPIGTLSVWCLAAVELLERLHSELP
ncbi:MAG: ATP-binding protein [Polyangiales bacterium]